LLVNLFGSCKLVTANYKVIEIFSDEGKRLPWSRVGVLAFGTQVRGFAPGQSRRVFRAKQSSVRLPSEGM
jgi:hypothetical protein